MLKALNKYKYDLLSSTAFYQTENINEIYNFDKTNIIIKDNKGKAAEV